MCKKLFLIIIFIQFISISFSQIDYEDIPYKYKFVWDNILNNDLSYLEYKSIEELFNINEIEKEIEEKGYKKILIEHNEDKDPSQVILQILFLLSIGSLIGLIITIILDWNGVGKNE